jgi:hypothetical protein
MRSDQDWSQAAVFTRDNTGEVGEVEPLCPVRQGVGFSTVGLASDLFEAAGYPCFAFLVALGANNPPGGQAEFADVLFEAIG